jgi:small subunit ribosomal protein S6
VDLIAESRESQRRIKFMRAYEITNILINEGSLVEETKKQIKEILSKFSAEITAEEDWGQKTLWHRIRGYETGFFTFLKCKAKPETIKEIEREFHLNQNILRSLIVKEK